MKRALVIHPSDGDFETRQLLRAIARDAPGTTDFVSVGPGGMYRDALSCARDMRLRRPGVIHTISSRALRACAFNGGAPILFTPLAPLTASDRIVQGMRDVTMVVHRHVVRERLGATRAVTMPLPSLAAGSSAEKSGDVASARAQLRTALGFAESDLVIVAPGESNRHTDHRLAVWVAIILHVLDARCRLLIWGRGERADQVERFARGLKFGNFTVAAEPMIEREIEHDDLLRCGDAILDSSTATSGVFASAHALATGLPLLAMPDSAAADLISRSGVGVKRSFNRLRICKSRKARFVAIELLELIRSAGPDSTSPPPPDETDSPTASNWRDFYDRAMRGLPLSSNTRSRPPRTRNDLVTSSSNPG